MGWDGGWAVELRPRSALPYRGIRTRHLKGVSLRGSIQRVTGFRRRKKKRKRGKEKRNPIEDELRPFCRLPLISTFAPYFYVGRENRVGDSRPCTSLRARKTCFFFIGRLNLICVSRIRVVVKRNLNSRHTCPPLLSLSYFVFFFGNER